MTRGQLITAEMVEEALKILHKRITEPPPPSVRSYSRKDAFLKLRARAKEALAAGHSLETILDDLNGVGIGMTIATTRQYMKPGRKIKRSQVQSPIVEAPKEKLGNAPASAIAERIQSRGTFAVAEDEAEI